MGPPELAGLAAVPESDVAAAKDAPAGWSRDVTLPLRKPGGGPLVGDNGQARRRLFVAECARACAGARRADKGASMGREAGPGSRGCVQADGGDSVVRIDGRVLRALARARRSRLCPIDRRVLSCAPRARAHVQEPIVSLRLRVLDSLGAGGGDDGDDKDGALIKTVDGGYNSGRRGPPRCFSSALCRLCSPAGCANAALCTAARAPARGGARHAQPHTHAHGRAPCSLRTQANPRTNSSARARAPHAQLLLPQDGVRRAVPRHGRGPPERLRRGPPGRGGPLAHAADPGARPRAPDGHAGIGPLSRRLAVSDRPLALLPWRVRASR